MSNRTLRCPDCKGETFGLYYPRGNVVAFCRTCETTFSLDLLVDPEGDEE